jgi:uncharacterized phage protein gp47/JayE
MAVIYDFENPSFSEGQDTNTILKEMLDDLPPDLDKSEGQFPYDLTKPIAIQKSQLVQFTMIEFLKNLFPMWAREQMLDYHAETRGLQRKPAVAATGIIQMTGILGTVINIGTRFSTVSVNGETNIEFVTTTEATLNGDIAVEASIQAVIAGIAGNVNASTITMPSTPINGLKTVTNTAATMGGVDLESDEALRSRILDYDQNKDNSFIGSDADYSRWALSVTGVGGVNIVRPADDTGVIQIVITDSVGNPASTELCTAVYNYIMSSDEPALRKSPINAQIDVIAPTTITVTVTATIVFVGNIDTIKADFVAQLTEYYKEALADGYIKYSKVAAILSGISGVSDYSNLLINGTAANVVIPSGNLPRTTIAEVTFTV